MAKPGKKDGENCCEKLRWIVLIIGLMITFGGGANAIYRARGDTLELINIVLIYTFLLGFIVCLHIEDGREGKGKIMIGVFITLLMGMVGWQCARAFMFGVVGQILFPPALIFGSLAFGLILAKCCASKEAAVIPIED